jgi:tetratricopeptide (TPR) repeat protein
MVVKIKDIKERLEGSYRLIRIKRIKLIFFGLQIALGIILGLVTALFLGMRFDPFYISLDAFLFLFLIIMLIVAAEAIYFKGLEIRYTRSRSRKFLIARNAVRRSGAIVAVSVVCLILLLLPFTTEKIEETYEMSETSAQIPVGSIDSFTFESQDRLGLTRVESLTVTINATSPAGPVLVQVFTEEGYQTGDNLTFDTSVSTSYPFYTRNIGSHSSMIDTFHVTLDPSINIAVYYYSWTVRSEVSPFITLYFPILAICFIIVEAAAIGIMLPIRRSHASASIYSKKYVAEAKSSEYFIEDRKPMTREEAKEEAMLESTLDIELPPPPPPPKPVPRPAVAPEEKEVVRKLGEVDEGIVEEPDIACPTCGEMNSPHAMICFVCGNPMEAMEEAVVVDIGDYISKGKDFANAGKYNDALQCFEEVLKKDKLNEAALVEKGIVLRRQGKWGMAIQHINTALQMNPRNMRALLQKAEILTERDKLDKALGLYNQILLFDPENEVAKAKIEELTEEAELEDAEDVIDIFMCVPGIGLARATSLYEAGFTSFAMLKEASESDLAEVKGISERLAKKIKKSLETME